MEHLPAYLIHQAPGPCPGCKQHKQHIRTPAVLPECHLHQVQLQVLQQRSQSHLCRVAPQGAPRPVPQSPHCSAPGGGPATQGAE